jgi:hypothetical protein
MPGAHMTDPALPPPVPHRKLNILHLSTLVLATAGFVVLVLWPRPVANGSLPAASDANAVREKVAALEDKVAALENRVNDLNARVAAGGTATSPLPELAKAGTTDIARLQSDVVALSAALTVLQAEFKQSSKDTAQNQRAAQSLYAAAIAFLQLRDAAGSGRGFVEELAAMRVATKGADAFQEPLAKLEPYALNGVPSVPALYVQFQSLATAAGQAVSQASAQNWWQRILATLRGLVVVRSVNDTLSPDDPISEIETDLSQGAVNTALTTMNNLPAAADETMKGWRAEAEARARVDQSLHMMAQLLVAAAMPPPAQGTQGAP